MDQQLQRYGQVELRENDEAYYICHVPCKKVVSYKRKTAFMGYTVLYQTPCKCGLPKKAMEFLTNIIKLMTRK